MAGLPQRALKLLIVAVLGGAIAFLALRTSPYVQYVPWIPRQLGVWADSNGIARNTLAFFALGVAVLGLCGARAWIVGALCAFGTLVEVAQLWIPGRIYDPKDIAASVAGVLLAWPVAWGWRRWLAAR